MSEPEREDYSAELEAEKTSDVTAADERPRSRWRTFASSQVFITLAFLLLLIAAFSLLAPGKFGTVNNLTLLAQNVAILTVVSVGTTFIIATAGIDLSIPSGIILGEVFTVKALQMIPVDERMAIAIPATDANVAVVVLPLFAALFAGLLLGAVNGLLVAYLRIAPFIATLATLGAGLGVALLLMNGVNAATYAIAEVADSDLFFGVSNLIVIALGVVILGYIGMHMSVFGRHTLAIGSNEEAVRRVGIDIKRHLLKVYIVGGVAAGFAGYLSVAYFTTTSVAGHATDNLRAITAVALGGTSLFGGVATIIGTVVGVWIPAVLQNGFIIIRVQPYWQMIAVGAVLVAAVALDQWRRRSQNRG
ncbi:MAG: ABC transporter permease [Candidatus Limnocylindrales bacterium]